LLTQGYGKPELVDRRRWFQVVVRLLRCCHGVETIEVPTEWADVTWYDGNFPRIDTTQFDQAKRQLSNGRWRFGRDPVVVREEVEQGDTEQESREREDEEEAVEGEMDDGEERSME
jgi:hypothetical protein